MTTRRDSGDTDDVVDAVLEIQPEKERNFVEQGDAGILNIDVITSYTPLPGDEPVSPRIQMRCPEGDYTIWAAGAGERCPNHHIFLVPVN